MNLSLSIIGDVQVVEVSGEVDRAAASHLYDTLVACVHAGQLKLIVDLSGTSCSTRENLGEVSVAAKLVRFLKGELRLCGADGDMRSLLAVCGPHCLHCLDADRATSLRILSATGDACPQKPDALQAGGSLMARLQRLVA